MAIKVSTETAEEIFQIVQRVRISLEPSEAADMLVSLFNDAVEETAEQQFAHGKAEGIAYQRQYGSV